MCGICVYTALLERARPAFARARCSSASLAGEFLERRSQHLLGGLEARRHQPQLRRHDLLAAAEEAKRGHLAHGELGAQRAEVVVVVRVDLRVARSESGRARKGAGARRVPRQGD